MPKKRDEKKGKEQAKKSPRPKKVNPIQIQKYLKGIDYPADKQDIIDYAQEEGADEKVLETLRGLPDRQFGTPADVNKALGEVH